MSKDGGPAFPSVPDRNGLHTYANGLTKRDYFAAAALQGLTAGTPGPHLVPPNAAELAYEYADAMLKAREPE